MQSSVLVSYQQDDDQEPQYVEHEEEIMTTIRGSDDTSRIENIIIITTPATSTTTQDAGDNLLGSILQGKFDKINWLDSMLGSSSSDAKTDKAEGRTDIIKSLFDGHFFGSAVSSNDNPKHTKRESNDRDLLMV